MIINTLTLLVINVLISKSIFVRIEGHKTLMFLFFIGNLDLRGKLG